MPSLFLIPIGIVLLLNLWVWLFPKSFINYLKLGKNAQIENIIPAQKAIWKFIEHPYYIWLPRLGFGLALLVIVAMIYWVNR
jgi:hypothetical protein